MVTLSIHGGTVVPKCKVSSCQSAAMDYWKFITKSCRPYRNSSQFMILSISCFAWDEKLRHMLGER